MTNTIMRILAIIIILRITEANLEDVDPTEVKIQVVSSEAKTFMAEVNEIKTHTKANIKMAAIKAIITKAIEDSIISHAEISLKVIATAILEAKAMAEAEAMAKAEAIIMAMVEVGLIFKVMLIINAISIMAMMISTKQSNMVHDVHYAVDIITPLNIVSRESMTSMILWKR